MFQGNVALWKCTVARLALAAKVCNNCRPSSRMADEEKDDDDQDKDKGGDKGCTSSYLNDRDGVSPRR